MTRANAAAGVETPRAVPEGRGQKSREYGSGASGATAISDNSWTEAGTRLMDDVVSRDNMMAAYDRVVSNKGAPGIDRMTVDQLKGYLTEHWPRIREELLNETYRPQAVLKVEIPKPDGGTRTMSRKYAYQVLLIEEFAKHAVDVVFIKSPHATTPEEHLLLQFQGMIAEYERAQIAERTRRGKRHRAKAGAINVLSGAPYGYRYVRKCETAGSYYEVIEHEAEIVRMVFELYTEASLSIGAINGRAPPLSAYNMNRRVRNRTHGVGGRRE